MLQPLLLKLSEKIVFAMIVAILWRHVEIKKQRDEFHEIINKQFSAISFNNYQIFFNLVSYSLFIIIQLKEKNHSLHNNGKGSERQKSLHRKSKKEHRKSKNLKRIQMSKVKLDFQCSDLS
jgi:hypothetical protein